MTDLELDIIVCVQCLYRFNCCISPSYCADCQDFIDEENINDEDINDMEDSKND